MRHEVYKPVSFEVFKKTKAEKEALKKAKLQWRSAMRLLHDGFTKKSAFKFSQKDLC